MKDQKYMLLALSLSQNALPSCLPNPPVGCVIVRNGHVIATGYTRQPGSNHAEIDAMSKLSGSLEDCEMYVTLEPCSFIGRTPSCAWEIVNRKVGHVYVSIIDPHNKNDGKGIDILTQNAIPVNLGLCEHEVKEFISPYLSF